MHGRLSSPSSRNPNVHFLILKLITLGHSTLFVSPVDSNFVFHKLTNMDGISKSILGFYGYAFTLR